MRRILNFLMRHSEFCRRSFGMHQSTFPRSCFEEGADFRGIVDNLFYICQIS